MSPPKLDLRARALKSLARREYSRAELTKKLAPEAESTEQLETLLDELTRQGFLSDARFSESRVNARAGRYGSRRIAQELRQKGVAKDLAEQAVVGLKENDLLTARALWRRKFGAPPGNIEEKARQIRFLAARGFSFDIIRRVLNEEE